jgi:ribosomal protein S18 acetylase RimI-like enzyme
VGGGSTAQDYRIRPMTAGDYDAVIAIWERLPGMGLSSADERPDIASFLEKNSTTCLVAESGGEIVGTLLGGWDGRRGYLYHVAVSAEFQGRGIGGRLLSEGEHRFAELGARRIHLMIYRDNEAASFYEKRGWFIRDELTLMSKDLV